MCEMAEFQVSINEWTGGGQPEAAGRIADLVEKIAVLTQRIFSVVSVAQDDRSGQ
jgi:hypothetical protein